MMTLKIATRQSPLALWQAKHVKSELIKFHPSLTVELVTFVTQGDKILDTPLAKIGGKGLFVKELEQALLDGRADIAVHSSKDMPMLLPDGLKLSCFLPRETPSDAFLSNRYAELDELPQGAVVGTSSLRRKCQLLARRPDLTIKDLRGNVGTRLAKLDAGEYDAIILAASGLKRLGLDARIKSELNFSVCLPAVGQGALAVECANNRPELDALLTPLVCAPTTACVQAERAMNRRLEGGCQVPIAGYAHVVDAVQNTLSLEGRVANADGSVLLKAQAAGAWADAESVGLQVAEDLLSQGADKILAAFYA